MGLREDMDSQFGKRVRDARGRRGWSQDELAKRLSDKGIDGVYASTIAKIEADHKPRAVRLAEASAIAELFDVSLDTLLGRSVSPQADEMFTLRALADTAQQAAWQASTIESTLRSRIAELATFNPPPKSVMRTIMASSERAADALAQVHAIITEALNPPEGSAIARQTRKLLRDMLDREDSDDDY